MIRKKKCNSESNSFVAAAEKICLQPVLEHRQRRGRRNIAWQAIPHLCFLPYILFLKYINILAPEMASPCREPALCGLCQLYRHTFVVKSRVQHAPKICHGLCTRFLRYVRRQTDTTLLAISK